MSSTSSTAAAATSTAAAKPTKFVEEPPALLCPVCGRVFSEPVISVKCGHTFCRECVQKLIREEGGRCPADGVECDSAGQLVLNRAVMGQIEDLKIYCCHGLITRNVGKSWEIDPDGCKEVDSHISYTRLYLLCFLFPPPPPLLLSPPPPGCDSRKT